MNRVIVGAVIMVILMLLPVIWAVGDTAYWFYKCWTEGGDWEYYAHRLIAFIWIIALFGTLAFMII